RGTGVGRIGEARPVKDGLQASRDSVTEGDQPGIQSALDNTADGIGGWAQWVDRAVVQRVDCIPQVAALVGGQVELGGSSRQVLDACPSDTTSIHQRRRLSD